MSIHDLVNVGRTLTTGATRPLQPAGEAPLLQGSTPSFITAQSLVSFPLASSLVAGFWKGAQVLVPNGGGSPWVCLAFALIVGLLIYWISVTDKRAALSRSETLIGLAIAIINSFYLFIAAIGIRTELQ